MPAIVLHGAHLAEYRAADEEIADAQRAVADQHGRHRTAAAIELRFDHRAHGRAASGFALRSCNVRHQQDHLEQQVEILPASWPKPAP